MTRQERIDEIRLLDNVGMLDGIDLEGMNEEDFSRLEADVVGYSVDRATAWENQFKKTKED